MRLRRGRRPPFHDTADRAAPQVVRARINRVFDTSHHTEHPDREYRDDEISRTCRSGGHQLSEAELGAVRGGTIPASDRVVAALAWWFCLPVSYFIDAAAHPEIDAELATRAARCADRIRDDQAAEVDLRAAEADFRDAIRLAGVTRMSICRASPGMTNRARARMLRALTEVLLEDDDEPDDADLA